LVSLRIACAGSEASWPEGARGERLSGRGRRASSHSHGRTGCYGGHHDTVEVLADGGFVVAAINHPGENAFDRSRVDELSVAAERPVDNKRLLDFMIDGWPDGSKIDRHLGEFGFSRGGYTALAVIGDTPDYGRGAGRCPRDLNEEQCDAGVLRGAPPVHPFRSSSFHACLTRPRPCPLSC